MKWKKVRDKNSKEREIHEISEDGFLRNSKTKKLLKLTELKSGYKTHKYHGIHYNVHDLVASTFLDIPKDALFSVHKTWNKTGRKYKDQSNHYSNLQWVTQNDIKQFSNNDMFYASKYGDFYRCIKGRYQLLPEEKSENGVSFYTVQNDNGKKKNYHVHKVVAKLFVDKLDESYKSSQREDNLHPSGMDCKFVFHKDGDITNNNCNNLIWKNTLEGVHNGKMYYSIPKFSKYVLDEEDNLLSYQKGVFTSMKLYERSDKYMRVTLTNDSGQSVSPLFHVLVASVHLDKIEGKNIVDHIDGDRTNYRKENLQRLNDSENIKKADRKPSKSRRVKQYNLEGELIETYSNAKDASKETSIDVNKIVVCASKNKNKKGYPHKSGKYRWTYCYEDKYVIQERELFKPVIIRERYDINEPKYLLSDKGVLLDPQGYQKSVWGDENCYKYCKIRGKNYLIHILVALLFAKGRSEGKNQVNHIDENPENYQATNLEWTTQSENIQHSIHRQCLSVEQIDIKTGLVINTFSSRAAAAEAMTRSRNSSAICLAAKKSMKTTAYGYYWRNVEK